MEESNMFRDLVYNIQYYLWWKPKDWYYDLKWFFGNLWRFRKQLWKYRTWGSYYSVSLFTDSLEWLKEAIENGDEEDRSRNKKVAAITELISLLKRCYDDTEFGTFDTDTFEIIIPKDKLAKTREKNRNKVLNRIFKIIKGQSIDDRKIDPTLNPEGWYDQWVENFDGTGIEGW